MHLFRIFCVSCLCSWVCGFAALALARHAGRLAEKDAAIWTLSKDTAQASARARLLQRRFQPSASAKDSYKQAAQRRHNRAGRLMFWAIESQVWPFLSASLLCACWHFVMLFSLGFWAKECKSMSHAVLWNYWDERFYWQRFFQPCCVVWYLTPYLQTLLCHLHLPSQTFAAFRLISHSMFPICAC